MTGKLNRRLLMEKYAKQIAQIFSRMDLNTHQVEYRASASHQVEYRASLMAEQHHPAAHQLSQIVEEEERQRERSTMEKEGERGHRKNITVVRLHEKSIYSDQSDDESESDVKRDENSEAEAVHENVKSVRFQSNVVQIQNYVDNDETAGAEEKRTRN